MGSGTPCGAHIFLMIFDSFLEAPPGNMIFFLSSQLWVGSFEAARTVWPFLLGSLSAQGRRYSNPFSIYERAGCCGSAHGSVFTIIFIDPMFVCDFLFWWLFSWCSDLFNLEFAQSPLWRPPPPFLLIFINFQLEFAQNPLWRLPPPFLLISIRF